MAVLTLLKTMFAREVAAHLALARAVVPVIVVTVAVASQSALPHVEAGNVVAACVETRFWRL